MSSPRILFYISGHGYGHARRCMQVMAHLRTIAPDAELRVRTAAPARIFARVLSPAQISPCAIDAGAAERSTLEIDPGGTLDRIAGAFARRDEVLREEAKALAEIKPVLIVSDIPFLAGDVAEAVGVPCVGMSNFTWDWIAEPFTQQFPGRRPLIDAMERSYAKMSAILRMPLGRVSRGFCKIIDVPLVANQSTRESEEVLETLQLPANDGRRRILFALRGAIPTDTLACVARSVPDIQLLCPTDEPGNLPAGVIPVLLGDASRGNFDFSDVLRISDAVVGKLGYGLVAECIASGVALLWPRRTGFREDEVVEREGPRVMRIREMPLDDFHAGRWAEHLRAAIDLPKPPERMRCDGAEVCAATILRLAAPLAGRT